MDYNSAHYINFRQESSSSGGGSSKGLLMMGLEKDTSNAATRHNKHSAGKSTSNFCLPINRVGFATDSLQVQSANSANSSLALFRDLNSAYQYSTTTCPQYLTQSALFSDPLKLNPSLPSVQQMASAIEKFEPGGSSSLAASSMLAGSVVGGGVNGNLNNRFSNFSPGNLATSPTNATMLNNACSYWPMCSSEWDLAAAIGTSGLDASCRGSSVALMNGSTAINYPTNYMTNYYYQNYYYGLRNGSASAAFPGYFTSSNVNPYPYTGRTSTGFEYQGGFPTAASSSGAYCNQESASLSLGNNSLHMNNSLPSTAATSVNSARNHQPSSMQYSSLSESKQFSLSPSANLAMRMPDPHTSPSCSNHVFTTGKIVKKKRAKKKKSNAKAATAATGFRGTAPGEYENETQVFVWELDDICPSFPELVNILNQMPTRCFQIKKMEELDHANVSLFLSLFYKLVKLEDASLDEALHDAESASFLKDTNSLTNDIRNSQQIDFKSNPLSGAEELISKQNGEPGCTPDPVSAECSGSPALAARLEGLKRAAATYAYIRKVYDQCRNSQAVLQNFFEDKRIFELINFLDKSADPEKKCGPVERYRHCLKQVAQKDSMLEFRCVNVILANESIPNALCKLMAYGYGEYVSPENVYSISKIGKEAALERITNRFHKKRIIVASSSLMETRQLAYRNGRIPFWGIREMYDIDKFRFALEYVLLVVNPSHIRDPMINNDQQQHEQKYQQMQNQPFMQFQTQS